MDASEFNRLLTADHYSPADLEQVDNLCRNYPMFNLAHMLKVRIREALGYEKAPDLKLAAIYAGDRRKLHGMVTGVTKPGFQEGEPVMEESEVIHFSAEPHGEADVIIAQHAPYAGQAKAGELLELDEAESEEGISSETLIEAFVKDEVEMEEPDTEDVDTPAIDVVEKEPEGSSNNRLILNFIREDPGPIRAEIKAVTREDVSKASIREHDGFITDTLAQIYVKQGLYAKAIYAYEKLSLKYPEKSAYFAAQIEKIRNINRS
jgi:hypothetical protein